ncbi:hypothetical protein [Arcobacter sp. FWKO B]|uniref:hypothetical protein n=1 Tax=Arcobacter sp. FWKO B TaxID=2593672 RepID=UPI0018A40883|nr:hypothetical protein [Arcobacter sp. FWKO B]QOG13005.1 hypothetical protein FWKOB_10030 [Arcobacter sp. FWKO B]
MKNEILNEIEQGLIKEDRICEKMIKLVHEYDNFIIDSNGLNFDEHQELKRKSLVLFEKLIYNLKSLLNIDILKFDFNIEKKLIILEVQKDEPTFKVSITIENDGFLMEIND